MSKVSVLVTQVDRVRNSYAALLANVDENEGNYKPTSDAWGMVEITEHLFWAEHGGVLGMWKTLHAIREGKMEGTFESIHKDLSIDEIIARTWKPKEQVPAVAAPRMGGTLIFWRSALLSLQSVLEDFGNDLKEEELRMQAHPHPISGPMDFQQRLEFLGFHIERHHHQAIEVRNRWATRI
ncbi:MAG TPA: DinB family protein [Chryseolinea sp.]|nr:DinB family protein [Chryseolinea sp.]